MTEDRFAAPLREGGVPSVSPGIGQADPPAIRAKLMLEAASHMMTEPDWPYRQAALTLRSQGDEIGTFQLFGANDPGSIKRVFDRELTVAIMNPAAILAMAHKGVGLFSEPMQVALIAVMPHYDQLGFAVTQASGLTSLDDIREKRFPLRLSVRGSMDACTTLLVQKVLNAHGFDYDDILAWGGSIQYEQPMPAESSPNRSSRIERVASGELDAIFEEGLVVWANRAVETGMRFLDIAEENLLLLERQGFRRGMMERARYDRLPDDVPTVDFSGWPIYTRIDTPDLVIRKFCQAMEARKDTILWNFGPAKQPPMPLERMMTESPSTPVDVPFHRAAREVWTELGYMTDGLDR